MIPLRSTVLFPGAIIPLTLGRPKSVAALREAEDSQVLVLAVQRSPEIDDPTPADLYPIGTITKVVKALRAGDEGYHLVCHGLARCRIVAVTSRAPFLKAEVVELIDEPADEVLCAEMAAKLKVEAQRYLELQSQGTSVIPDALDPGALADLVAANVDVSTEVKVDIFAEVDRVRRLERVRAALQMAIDVPEIKQAIRRYVTGELNTQQLRAILEGQTARLEASIG